MTISIERGQLPAAAGSFQQAGEAISAEVDRLIDQLDAMDWDGDAHKAFQTLHALWASKTKVHQDKLRAAGEALVVADRRHTTTDEANKESSTRFTASIQGALGSSS
ncbi:MAG: WXG100 family type VII secretion target [Mycobacteriales bacterium]